MYGRSHRWVGNGLAGGRHLGRCLSWGLVLGLAVAAGAQEQRIYNRVVPALHRSTGIPDGLVICTLAFGKDRIEPDGSGWVTDYPMAGRNLGLRVPEVTTVRRDERYDQRVVMGDEPGLFECPFLIASDVGVMRLTDAEAAGLRAYLAKGGFLWVDDFWGDASHVQWYEELARIMPPGSTIRPLTNEHHILGLVAPAEMVQVSNIGNWRSGRSTEQDAPQVPFEMVLSAEGWPLVLASRNTDIADGWEQEGAHQQFFYDISVNAYALGTNVLVYAMTH